MNESTLDALLKNVKEQARPMSNACKFTGMHYFLDGYYKIHNSNIIPTCFRCMIDEEMIKGVAATNDIIYDDTGWFTFFEDK